eukprot:gene14399-15898_t
MAVRKDLLTMKELKQRELDFVTIGGKWNPTDCIAKSKVAVIIPLRDRSEHLFMLLRQLHVILKRQNLLYQIFVIEQDDEYPFNRGKLMNTGFKEALKIFDFNCFVFHDVDLIPENDQNDYGCPNSPRHMSVAVDKFNYKLPYQGLFGGVESFSENHFRLVNGFSNSYWGWGAEDDDMYKRIVKSKLVLHRPSVDHGRYTMIKHKQSERPPDRLDKLQVAENSFSNNGLVALLYQDLKNSLRIKLIEMTYSFCQCVVSCAYGYTDFFKRMGFSSADTACWKRLIRIGSKSFRCCNGRIVYKPGGGRGHCCGRSAYNPMLQICCGNKVYRKRERYMTCCGNKPYSRRSQGCCNNELIERRRQGCCRNVKYDIKTHTCCEGTLIPLFGGASDCCGAFLYQKKDFICCAGFLQDFAKSGRNNTACCGHQSYDKTTRLCCALQPVLKRKADQDQCCYGQPYNSKKQFCCDYKVADIKEGENPGCCRTRPRYTRKDSRQESERKAEKSDVTIHGKGLYDDNK